MVYLLDGVPISKWDIPSLIGYGKTTCFLADIVDFAAFNEVYGKYITCALARSCVAVKNFPKNALVEVELIAVIDGRREPKVKG